MDILIYSQLASMGGSTRLLLNLARALGSEHSVSVALGGTHTPEATRALLQEYRDVAVVPARREQQLGRSFDVAVLHQPFTLDWSMDVPVKKRIAVIMELEKPGKIPVSNDTAGRFDRILHLHPDQISHLGAASISGRCALMPIIDNVDFEPKFVKSRYVGSVGASHKTQVPDALGFFEALPEDYGLRMWSADKLSLQGLPMPALGSAMQSLASGRLQFLPATADVKSLLASYDALLHLPRLGNGTSVVVSDALRSGKLVILTPLPAYRVAYGGLAGVLFNDHPKTELVAMVRDYGRDEFEQIRRTYGERYNREEAVNQWIQEITG